MRPLAYPSSQSLGSRLDAIELRIIVSVGNALQYNELP